jgi:uncharacterized membrane protein YtjA (UPF0391 family)
MRLVTALALLAALAAGFRGLVDSDAGIIELALSAGITLLVITLIHDAR